MVSTQSGVSSGQSPASTSPSTRISGSAALVRNGALPSCASNCAEQACAPEPSPSTPPMSVQPNSARSLALAEAAITVCVTRATK